MKKLKVCWLSAGVSSFVAGYFRDFVLSDIKKIELEDTAKDVEDFIELMNKFKSEVEE